MEIENDSNIDMPLTVTTTTHQLPGPAQQLETCNIPEPRAQNSKGRKGSFQHTPKPMRARNDVWAAGADRHPRMPQSGQGARFLRPKP